MTNSGNRWLGRIGAVVVLWAAMGLSSTLMHAATTEPSVRMHSLLGSYLAGRYARGQRDMDAAAEFYRSALKRDPGNSDIARQAFLTEAAIGNWSQVEQLAEKIVKSGGENRIARVFLGIKSFRNGDYTKADEHLAKASVGPIGELTAVLARAWVKAAEKDTKSAFAMLEKLRKAEWAHFYRRYHHGLIAEINGDTDLANKSYAGVFANEPRTLRIALAYAHSLAANGNRKKALEVLRTHIKNTSGTHPIPRALLSKLMNGETVGPMLASPTEGMSEVFFGLGEALTSEGGIDIGTIYLQFALYLNPKQPLTLNALASVYEATGRYELAIKLYEQIPQDSPVRLLSELRRAFILNRVDRLEDAKKALLSLFERLEGEVAKLRSDKHDATPRANVSFDLPSGNTIQLGARDDTVNSIQSLLTDLGYPLGEIDGIFGPRTRLAIQEFQRQHGLQADGIIGDNTAQKLRQPALRSDDVRELQQMLKSQGYNIANIDGKIGPQTRLAIEKFRNDEKIDEQLDLAEVYSAARRIPERALKQSRMARTLHALGNIMRGRQSYKEAADFYSRAISLAGSKHRGLWNYYYARGVSYERLKQWPKAEADLLKALELSPDQPLVLNYLGYSWVDQKINLDNGMNLIKKAVKVKPDDGYFVDSLGWAYYRLGNFTSAVTYLERAVELKPEDPIINDHLGDSYWRVGRFLEARYQWKQALSLKPEDEDRKTIESKLERGMQVTEPAKVVQKPPANSDAPSKANDAGQAN